jgi:hypothetical protein
MGELLLPNSEEPNVLTQSMSCVSGKTSPKISEVDS